MHSVIRSAAMNILWCWRKGQCAWLDARCSEPSGCTLHNAPPDSNPGYFRHTELSFSRPKPVICFSEKSRVVTFDSVLRLLEKSREVAGTYLTPLTPPLELRGETRAVQASPALSSSEFSQQSQSIPRWMATDTVPSKDWNYFRKKCSCLCTRAQYRNVYWHEGCESKYVLEAWDGGEFSLHWQASGAVLLPCSFTRHLPCCCDAGVRGWGS